MLKFTHAGTHTLELDTCVMQGLLRAAETDGKRTGLSHTHTHTHTHTHSTCVRGRLRGKKKRE